MRSFASLRMTVVERISAQGITVRLHEAERGGVHAVAEASGFGAVVEDVAEVGVAFGAGDRGADHAESCVTDFGHVLFGDGSPEAGPSGARVEFRGGVEERVVAADAAVDAFVVQVPVFSGKGDFSVGVAGDVEDAGAEAAGAIGRAVLITLGMRTCFRRSSVVGEEDDGDVFGFRERRGRGVQYCGAFSIAKSQGPQWSRSKLRGKRDVACWVTWQPSFARPDSRRRLSPHELVRGLDRNRTSGLRGIFSFAPAGLGHDSSSNFPRLAPWAAFLRRFAAIWVEFVSPLSIRSAHSLSRLLTFRCRALGIPGAGARPWGRR